MIRDRVILYCYFVVNIYHRLFEDYTYTYIYVYVMYLFYKRIPHV